MVRWRRHDQSFLLVFYTLFFMDLYTLARSEDDCTNLTCSNNNCSECRHHGSILYPMLSAVFFLSLAILVQTVQYAYIGQTVDFTATAPSDCKLVNLLCYVDDCQSVGLSVC